MRLLWAFLGALGGLVGIFAIANAASDIQFILAAGAFTFAAVCGTNATICHLAIQNDARLRNAPNPSAPLAPPPAESRDGELLAALDAIHAELTWQRQQKEKELHREKAAPSKKPSTPA